LGRCVPHESVANGPDPRIEEHGSFESIARRVDAFEPALEDLGALDV
jgi:hypothetical protein